MKRLVCLLFICSLFLGGCCHHKCQCVQKEEPQEHRSILGKMKDGVMKADASFRENAW